MIPKECKRLAEVDFPIAVVSKHAAREKSIRHGHPRPRCTCGGRGDHWWLVARCCLGCCCLTRAASIARGNSKRRRANYCAILRQSRLPGPISSA